jgi:hypothetical protein
MRRHDRRGSDILAKTGIAHKAARIIRGLFRLRQIPWILYPFLLSNGRLRLYATHTTGTRICRLENTYLEDSQLF